MVRAHLFRQTWYSTGYSYYRVMFLPLPDYIERETGERYTFTVIGSATGVSYASAAANVLAKYGLRK